MVAASMSGVVTGFNAMLFPLWLMANGRWLTADQDNPSLHH
jgi:hypothetical protein